MLKIHYVERVGLTLLVGLLLALTLLNYNCVKYTCLLLPSFWKFSFFTLRSHNLQIPIQFFSSFTVQNTSASQRNEFCLTPHCTASLGDESIQKAAKTC